MRVPFHIAIAAIILALFSPSRFLSFQEKITKPSGIPIATNDNSVRVVCRAFWVSFGIVIFAGAIGYLAGFCLRQALGSPTPIAVATLQIIGASILLLATIYVRGAAIETYKGETLIERVDRWIYCIGYFLGTSTIVASLAWS